jgi:sulfur relay (sulfurtransferase) DsrC/TusE family protein
MIDLIHLLSKHLKETPYEARRDIDNFLYQLFPNGPDKQLAKIAGLPQPVPAE